MLRLLDLFCGAGGATKGYQRAGFYVVGVDIKPQPNYCGDEFFRDHALGLLRTIVETPALLAEIDAIHASPPCQRYSVMSSCRPDLAIEYPDMIGRTRKLLDATGLPYVIENVPGSPLLDPVTLCGHMFDLPLYRHRLFETNWHLDPPVHPPHVVPASKAGHWRPGTIISVAGHVSPIGLAREAMGIDWTTRDELSEAIPPAYTEFIGKQLLDHLAIQPAA